MALHRTQITYLSIADGAAVLGVHPRTIRRWIDAGRLTGYRVGPSIIRLDPTEVAALLRPVPAAGAADSGLARHDGPASSAR